MIRYVLLLFWLASTVGMAQVPRRDGPHTIDLGKFQVLGKMRGTQLELIDPGSLPQATLRRLSRWQLDRLETELLIDEKPSKGGKADAH